MGATPTSEPTYPPTTEPTGDPTTAPTAAPTVAPTVTPVCKYSKAKKCIAGGCIWTPGTKKKPPKCEACSALLPKKCAAAGCIFTKARGKKPAACESCTDQKEKNCLKKGCVQVKKGDNPKACTSCASLSGRAGVCITAKCAFEKSSKKCGPCAAVKSQKLCDKNKACTWKPGKRGKPGKCGKVSGKIVLSCCDLYNFGSPEYKQCCLSGVFGTCPAKCDDVEKEPGFTELNSINRVVSWNRGIVCCTACVAKHGENEGTACGTI